MSSCSQVDFYQLESGRMAPDRLACRLALMAWERGHRVSIVAGDEQQAAAMDELLWSFPEQRFVPHGRSGSPEAVGAPVVISTRAPRGAAEVVINLTGEALPGLDAIQRLLEIVPRDESGREAARARYKAYLQQGIKPGFHKIN